MTEAPRSAPAAATRGSAVNLLFLFASLAVVFVAGALLKGDGISKEAAVIDSVCAHLLANTTEGRQALVGSIWWPPLPVLLSLPFTWLIGSRAVPMGPLIVAGLCSAGSLILLRQAGRDWRLHGVTMLGVFGLLMAPSFLSMTLGGSRGAVVVLFVLLTAISLARWIEKRELSALVMLGLGCGLLTLSSAEMLPWMMLVIGLVLLDQVTTRASAHKKEAVVLLALLPAAYAIGLWVLMNWLVMGDGLYFLNSLMHWPLKLGAVAEGPEVGAVALACTGCCVVAIIVAALRRRKAGALLALLGVGVVALAAVFRSAGIQWASSTVMVNAVPLTVVAVGYALQGLGRGARWIGAGGTLVLLLAAGSVTSGAAAGNATEGLNAVTTERDMWLPRIERHVLARSKFSKVFVCGYEGFAFIRGNPTDLFVNSLDFNFNQAKKDYAGHELYILLRKPVGRDAMESIYVRFDDIFTLGGISTLYDGDWGDWRLFQIVHAPSAEPLL